MRVHLSSALNMFWSERDPNVKKHSGAIISVAVHMHLLLSHASEQLILVGQVMYPKTIGKNNGYKSLYLEQV